MENDFQPTMTDPVTASGSTAPALTPEVQVSRTLDALPGLVGAVDHAIREQTGTYQPFVLLVFAGGAALHAANFDAAQAHAALRQLVARWEEAPPIVEDGPKGEPASNAAS